MILPRDNEKDLPDIPENLRTAMKLHFVETMDQVLKIALGIASAIDWGRGHTADRTGIDINDSGQPHGTSVSLLGNKEARRKRAFFVSSVFLCALCGEDSLRARFTDTLAHPGDRPLHTFREPLLERRTLSLRDITKPHSTGICSRPHDRAIDVEHFLGAW